MTEEMAVAVLNVYSRYWKSHPGADGNLNRMKNALERVFLAPAFVNGAVDRALDAWFADPKWREVYADGPDVRAYMHRAIEAALGQAAPGGEDIS